MVTELFQFWRGTPLMKKAVAEFNNMLSNDEYIFNQVWKHLMEGKDLDRIPQSIYDVDIKVNTQEKNIRLLLVEHLTLHPKHDTSGCLALMSIVKDAERIGDYAKNIIEVEVLYKGTVKDIKYFTSLVAVQQKIADHFPILIKAFKESNTEMADLIFQNYVSIKEECDSLLKAVFFDQLPVQDAIATALLSRYLKRINSHINNIVSGIVYPINEIDFVRGDILE